MCAQDTICSRRASRAFRFGRVSRVASVVAIALGTLCSSAFAAKDGMLDLGFAPSFGLGSAHPYVPVAVSGEFYYVCIRENPNTWNGSIQRLRRDGTRDVSFECEISGDFRKVFPMADGGVVVFGGYSETDWPPSRTGAVRRLNASGALDPDFFRSTFTYRDGDLPEFVDAAVDSLGRIYVSGIFDTVNDQPRVGLVRFLPDGTVDPTFAPTRVVIPSAVAFTPGEKLVALVFGQDLVWFNDDGSVENSITFPTGHKEYPFAVASDGRIAMVGTDDRVRVYLPDGTADGSFSSDVNLGPVNRIAWDGNKILACASTNGSWGNPIHGVVRLNADGSRDMTWSRSAVCADRTWVGNITRDSDGSWLISGLFTSFAGVPRAGVARLEPAEATELTWFNTSARGRVTAADPLIVGFVVGGNAPQSLLVRGVGQSLDQFGITDTLAQPVLRVHRGETLLLERKGRSDTVDVDAVAQEVGAFALGPTSNGDAADLIVLPPGAYTLVISSGDGTEGTALGEVYSLDAQ